jgi:hypothetical protein
MKPLPLLMFFLAAAIGYAQVPADIEAGLQKIGHIVDPSCTAKLYRPLMPKNDISSGVTPLYPGITIARDVAFGSDPKDVADIFTAERGAENRTVVIFVPGGPGNKTEQQDKNTIAFYDNIGRWATKNGMVGVLMQRHPGRNWNDPAKDVSTMIQWVEANIGKYKGNPNRIFIWCQSAGNGPVGTYIGRPELYGPKGVGVVGAIFMSGEWNIAPLKVPQQAGGGLREAFAGAGTNCGGSSPFAADGAISGPSRATAIPMSAVAGQLQQPDAATQLERSTLPAFRMTKVKLLFVSAELDPGVSGGKMSAFYQTLHDDLCKLGADHCPAMFLAKGQNHMSELFSIDTADTSVSGPILKWMQSVK